MAPIDAAVVAHDLGVLETAVSLVHHGENSIYRIEQDGGCVALRLYRPGRRSRAEIEAEWAWAGALGPKVRTPQPALDGKGGLIRMVQGQFAVAMQWLDGTALDFNDHDDVRALGAAIGSLRRRVDEVVSDASPAWLGRQRPTFSPEVALQRPLAVLDAAGLLDSSQRSRLQSLLEVARARLAAHSIRADTWVHGDLHPGNVMRTEVGVAVLDLDDSRWAPAELEWAQPRTHLRGRGRFAQAWPLLLEASGLDPAPTRLRIVTALHLFDTMAGFAEHLDMAAFANPAAVVDRYLGYVAAELLDDSLDDSLDEPIC